MNVEGGQWPEWGIEWSEKAAGYPDVSGPFATRAEAEVRLAESVFDGRVVCRTVTVTDWDLAPVPLRDTPPSTVDSTAC